MASDFKACTGAPTGPANNVNAPAPNACLAGDPATDKQFSSSQLGWTPHVRRANGDPNLSVGAGALVNPNNTPGGAPSAGLGASQTLAKGGAATGVVGASGLGVARLDADLLLWIPVQINGGLFQSTLTLTAI